MNDPIHMEPATDQILKRKPALRTRLKELILSRARMPIPVLTLTCVADGIELAQRQKEQARRHEECARLRRIERRRRRERRHSEQDEDWLSTLIADERAFPNDAEPFLIEEETERPAVMFPALGRVLVHGLFPVEATASSSQLLRIARTRAFDLERIYQAEKEREEKEEAERSAELKRIADAYAPRKRLIEQKAERTSAYAAYAGNFETERQKQKEEAKEEARRQRGRTVRCAARGDGEP